jgi:hypothetical protein
MRITMSKPEMPLGAYPQDLLWGHVGSAPTRNKRSTTSNTVKIVTRSLPRLRSYNCSRSQTNTARTDVLWGEHLMSELRGFNDLFDARFLEWDIDDIGMVVRNRNF